ncbi:MAG: hypothetical protein V3U02_09625 [Calditrichia bacterium]
MKKNINNLLIVFIILIIIFICDVQSSQSGVWKINDSTRVQFDVTEPKVYPSSLWISSQFIPSPELISVKDDRLRFGLRWQVTPLLYSFGINRKLNPWRYFVVEPLVRQNGSIELFFTPEWLNVTNKFKTNWLFRGGIRVYVPLYRRGEYLSGSLAASYYNFNGDQGISYEAGIYLFFGILGFQVTYSPEMKTSPWVFTLRLRYF